MVRRLGLPWLGMGLGRLGTRFRLGIGMVGSRLGMGLESILVLAVVFVQRLGTMVVRESRLCLRLSTLIFEFHTRQRLLGVTSSLRPLFVRESGECDFPSCSARFSTEVGTCLSYCSSTMLSISRVGPT